MLKDRSAEATVVELSEMCADGFDKIKRM